MLVLGRKNLPRFEVAFSDEQHYKSRLLSLYVGTSSNSRICTSRNLCKLRICCDFTSSLQVDLLMLKDPLKISTLSLQIPGSTTAVQVAASCYKLLGIF